MIEAPKVILKNDADFKGFPHFTLLREEGLKHLGELSGKIWTDHNIHDPGITILEVLCYALVDLGYRTQLPIEDLLAVDPNSTEVDNNFFTPAEILTCNPTTILDYRKMLMDIDGVKNAWLEICKENKVPLFINCEKHQEIPKNVVALNNNNNNKEHQLTCNGQDDFYKVKLNGLYQVSIELDNADPFCKTLKEDTDLENKVLAEVRKRLQQYRNLGEDFKNISFLCQKQLGVCVEVDIDNEANAIAVYADILWKIRNFLQPDLNYYTLSELLDKGHSIETIYEGRPFRKESFGFIDSEELKQIKHRKEIHLSDLYQLAATVKGVKQVLQLKLVDCNGTAITSNKDCGTWIYQIPKDHTVNLCFDCSTIDIHQGNSRATINQKDLSRLLKDRLSQNKKVLYKEDSIHLNKALPSGQYRVDLAEYVSIQNEFPLVYGIGEVGLPRSVSDKRRAQALQLKGYLLFFDQILANYLSQLANVRQLFSFAPDSTRNGSAKTSFSQRLDSVPLIEELIRFYNHKDKNKNAKNNKFDWSEGTVLALPTRMEDIQAQLNLLTDYPEMELNVPLLQEDEAFKRNVIRNTFIRELSQDNYQISLYEDSCGHFFIISIPNEPIILVGKQRYINMEKGREAAGAIVFLAAQKNVYRLINDAALSTPAYSFELVFKSINYLETLQGLVEDEVSYCQKRNQFLDHLLARFSERFSDYALLMYQSENANQLNKNILETKACFLSNYPEISRNRGKAYNYALNGWNNDNISGLEKRLATLSGIKNSGTSNLCNFELYDYGNAYRFEWQDEMGGVIFKSDNIYKTETKAETALNSFLAALSDPTAYIIEDFPKQDCYRLGLKYKGGIVWSPKEYITKAGRDAQLVGLINLHQTDVREDTICVSKYVWKHNLVDALDKSVFEQKEAIEKEVDTHNNKLLQNFLNKINQQKDLRTKEKQASLKLVQHAHKPDLHLNVKRLQEAHFKHKTYYKWQWSDTQGNQLLKSRASFENEQIATTNFLDLIGNNLSELNLIKDHTIGIRLEDNRKVVLANQSFSDENTRDLAFDKLNNQLLKADSHSVYFEKVATAYQWELKDSNGFTLMQSHQLYRNKKQIDHHWRQAKKIAEATNSLKFYSTQTGSYRIELRTKNDQLLAYSPFYVGAIEKQKLSIVQELLAQQKNGEINAVEEAYDFTIIQAEIKTEFLKSHALFPSKAAAYEEMKLVLLFGKESKYFLNTGDEANLNFSFALHNQDNHFLASHPNSYNTAGERNDAVKQLIVFLKDFQFPFSHQEVYAYQLYKEDKVLLESEQHYPSINEARIHFTTDLPHFSNEGIYTRNDESTTTFFSYHLKTASAAAQSIEVFDTASKRDKALNSIIHLLESHSYTTKTNKIANKWKFKFWSRKDKDYPLLISNKAYNTEQNAIDAYNKLCANFANIALQASTQKEFLFEATIEGEATPIAVHPRNDDEVGEEVLAKTEKTLQYLANLKVPNIETENIILPDPENERGKVVYRIAKKNQPLAFFPCECFDSFQQMQETIEQLCHRAIDGYSYLEICLSGDITCLLVDKATGLNIFRYVIRDKRTGEIYFFSYQQYATEAEAITAFKENYLSIIEAASAIAQYGNNIALAHPPINKDNRTCEADSLPLVYINPSILKKYEAAELVNLFCSYPIRLLEKELANDGCKSNKEQTYFFQLSNPEDKNKLDWKSTNCYHSLEEAYQDFKYFLYLLSFKGNFTSYQDDTGQLYCWSKNHWPTEEELEKGICKTIDDNQIKESNNNNPEEKIKKCCCFISLREVFLESKNRYCAKKQDKPNIEGPLEMIIGGADENVVKLTTNCKLPEVDCNEAWEGLEKLLKIGCEDWAYYTCFDEKKCCYTFWIVDKDFQLGCHPFTYHTTKERDAKIEEAIKYCQFIEDDMLKVDAKPKEDATDEIIKYSFLISKKSNKEPIWEGITSYATVEEAETAGYQALQFAKEIQFYDKEDSKTNNLYAKSKAVINNRSDSIIAKQVSQKYSKIDLMAIAKKHPIVKKENGYSFQIFSEKFQSSTFDDSKPVTNASHGFKPVNGAIIWESKECYTSLAEAEDKYYTFCDSIQEANIKPTEKENCGGFSFELTDRSKILACHPQCYALISEVEAAIERTKACVNKEGFHLIEHILLRPRVVEDCNCLFPVTPFCECAVCMDPEEVDFCDRLEVRDISNETIKESIRTKQSVIQLPATFMLNGEVVKMTATVIHPNYEQNDGKIIIAFNPDISQFIDVTLLDELGNPVGENLSKGEYYLEIKVKEEGEDPDQQINWTYSFTLKDWHKKILLEQASFGKENGRAKVIMEKDQKAEDYTFEWIDSKGSVIEANNLGAGNYEVVVTSTKDLECTHTIPFTINDNNGKYIPNADPYSFWATIVLPGWTKKYRDYEFRKYFYDLILKEAPAHIAFRLVWLSPKDMCKVENQYLEWRKWLANKTCSNEIEQNILCDFVNCLSNLADMPPCIEEAEQNLCSGKESQITRIHKTSWLTNLLFNINTDFDFLNLSIPNLFGSSSNYIPIPLINLPVIFKPVIPLVPVLPVLPIIPPFVETNSIELTAIKDVNDVVQDSVVTTDNNRIEKKDIKKSASPKDWKSSRRKNYLANIQAIATKKLSATGSYKKTNEFLKNHRPDIATYEKLVEYIIRYAIRKKGGTSDEDYFVLIHNATAHLLDHLIVTDSNKLQYKEQLIACLEKQKKEQANFQILLDYWQPNKLKKATKAKAITAYQKMIKAMG